MTTDLKPLQTYQSLPLPLPPGPIGLRFIWSKLELAFNVLGSLKKLAHQYGDVVQIDKNTYLVNHPDYVEHVLVNTNKLFLYNVYKGVEDAAFQFWGKGLPVNQGESWLQQRRLIHPSFHRQHLTDYGQVMVTYTKRMLDTWKAGKACNLRQNLMRLSLEIAANLILGLHHTTPEVNEIEVAVQAAYNLFNNPAQLDVAIQTKDKKAFQSSMPRLDAIVYDAINRRRVEPRQDIVSQLLNIQDEAGTPISDKQLRDEAVTLLRGSHKNNPVLLVWVWYLLSKHPHVEGKLITELKEVLNGSPPTFADLPHLPYTEMVIKETMRLYPLYPAMRREALVDCEIGGYRIPAGSDVVVSPWLMHRDPRYFYESDTFMPERWGNDLETRLPRYVYFPFGGGTRLCIVKDYAMMEATFILTTVAQQFKLQVPANYRPKQLHAFGGLRPKNDLIIVPVRR